MGRKANIRIEKAAQKQRILDAGFLSELFPKVQSISIGMNYSQTGVLEPLSRQVNFSPSSSAVFRMSCLCSDCAEGGLDFTKAINSMVKTRTTTSKGIISCDKCEIPECRNVAYTITIKYSPAK